MRSTSPRRPVRLAARATLALAAAALLGCGGDAAKAIDCGVPPGVANASAPNVSGGLGGGSTASLAAIGAYACDSGFAKVGSDTVCQPDGTWSVPPTCAAITCPTAAPANGSVSAPAVAFGDSASYACDAGFALTGSAPTCGGATNPGTLTGAEPTCVAITCAAMAPANGTVDGGTSPATVAFGASATYACGAGFALTGAAPTCDGIANPGTLSGAEPTCAVIACAASAPANGTVDGGTTPATVAYGASATYACGAGFALTGTAPTCGGAANPGTLSGAEPTCAAITCAASAPANGTVDGGTTPATVAYGGSATYACGAGFALTGTAPTCGGAANPGALSGAEPTCAAITCTASAPTNGTVDGGAGPATVAFGASASYACGSGYDLTGTAPICGGTANPGTLAGPEPTCVAHTCQAAAPLHGTVDGGTATVTLGFGESAQYACDLGYALSGAADVTCGSGDQVPTCEVIVCRAAAPSHGMVDGGSVARLELGQEAVYTCTDGYTLLGTAPTCVDMDTFDGPEPTCEPVADACDYAFDARASLVTKLALGNKDGQPDACCFDFNGDGKIDSKLGSILKAFSSIWDADKAMRDQLAAGQLIVLLETSGVTSVANDASLEVHELFGHDADADLANNAAGTGSFVADKSSFMPKLDQPRYGGPGSIASGTLAVGPVPLALQFPIFGTDVVLPVQRGRIEGHVALGANGVGLAISAVPPALDAKLGGVILKTDLVAALNQSIASCTCADFQVCAGTTVRCTSNADCTSGTHTCVTDPADHVLIGTDGACNTANTEQCASSGDACGQLVGFCGVMLAALSPDIDLDSDGTKDGISIGMWFGATSATIARVVDYSGDPPVDQCMGP